MTTIFAIIASSLSVAGYLPYLRDIKKGKTKPHIFSWIIWTLMSGIFFFAQLSDGAGIGALTSGVTTVISTYIILTCFKQSEKSIKPIDWLSFAISIVALLAWLFTQAPTYSVILIAISDFAALLPTIRKSLVNPQSETASTYTISGVKHIVNLFSLEKITFVSSFYTFYLIIANAILTTILIVRRKQLGLKN